ncbi:MAG: hypothetical protein ABIH82_01465 [Candidatus Woesearchaeota archaeon]
MPNYFDDFPDFKQAVFSRLYNGLPEDDLDARIAHCCDRLGESVPDLADHLKPDYLASLENIYLESMTFESQTPEVHQGVIIPLIRKTH